MTQTRQSSSLSPTTASFIIKSDMAILCDVYKCLFGLGALPTYVKRFDKCSNVFFLLKSTFDYFEAGAKLGCQICLLFLSLMSQEERDKMDRQSPALGVADLESCGDGGELWWVTRFYVHMKIQDLDNGSLGIESIQ